MNNESDKSNKFSPLSTTLKEKLVVFSLLMIIIFILDLNHGSPFATKLIMIQFKLRGIDPLMHNFRLSSIFGIYDSIPALAHVIDKAGAIFFFVISSINVIRGLLLSIANKPLEDM